MAMETLRPSAHSVAVLNAGAVANPQRFYDANENNNGRLKVPAPDDYAEVKLFSVAAPSGAVSLIELKAKREWATADTNDYTTLYCRGDPGDPWTQEQIIYAPDDFPNGSPATQTFDVTATIGSGSDWQVLLGMFNGPGTPPPPQHS